MTLDADDANLSPVLTGLKCRCPRCGRGRLFRGFLTLAPACDACGLDYGFADSGDGPAVFVSTIAGTVVVALALWIEVEYEPPFWVHVLVSLPLTLVMCLGILRPFKGVLIALQYRNRAEEGHLEP